MFDGAVFFNTFSHLKPLHQPLVGDGRCACRPSVLQPVFKRTSDTRCAACTALSQAYPIEGGKQNRLVFSYLLITETAVTFWGKNKLDEIDPRIECRPAAGMMRQVMQGLILDPPPPPWMFISFSQSPVTAADLHITTDNAVIAFSGKTLVSSIPVTEINREAVLSLRELGLPPKVWRQYLNALIDMRDLKTIHEIEATYPGLRDVKWPPPCESGEMAALLLTAEP